jgi:16S rRNA A1518/A1519 N6-dimethyltransferase RsmA/KsgA/DIM1 with predicted DNA glycosylase/AP lyase activity
MSYPEQAKLIDNVRAVRLHALSVAKSAPRKITKSAMKNIAKNKGKRKMLKDPTIAATKALKKLSPEQIAKLAKCFKI